jgi:hypothetical protein
LALVHRRDLQAVHETHEVVLQRGNYSILKPR